MLLLKDGPFLKVETVIHLVVSNMHTKMVHLTVFQLLSTLLLVVKSLVSPSPFGDLHGHLHGEITISGKPLTPTMILGKSLFLSVTLP